MLTVMPTVISALGTIQKGMIKTAEDMEIRVQMETIQTTASRSARILRRVLETCCHLKFRGKPLANAGVKNSQGNNNNNNNNNNKW